jgi:ATP-dependent helicase/nuclease subunit B
MGQQSVRPQRPSHPRVAILGQLESRLNLADLVLIGGLNEGVWPRATDTGPWLNRDMRKQLGLPPAEQAIGIAAHDFVMNAMAPHIVLSRARKDQSGAPTLPSRWLSRLTAVLRANDLMADVMPEPARAIWVAALDKPALPIWPQPISRPRPNPPAAARPRSYWATHLQELVSDPYRHYARRILKLRELEPLDADPGPMERGQIIHAAIEEFLLRYPSGPLPEDACDVLLAIGQKVFDIYRNEPRIAVVWWPRFRQIAAWFVDMEGQRRRDVARVLTEIEGELRLAASPGSAAEIRIRARADRIEIGKDGTLNIGDYKTGALPSATDVRSGAAPQLPIEAAIALAGGFDGVNTTKLASLSLWGLRGGDPAGLLMDPTLKRDKAELSAEELARRAREWLERLAHYLEDPATTYDAVPKPAIARRDDGYEHLSRVAEWYGSDTAPASPDGRSDR